MRNVNCNWWLGAGIYASESNTTIATSATYLGEIEGNSTSHEHPQIFSFAGVNKSPASLYPYLEVLLQ